MRILPLLWQAAYESHPPMRWFVVPCLTSTAPSCIHSCHSRLLRLDIRGPAGAARQGAGRRARRAWAAGATRRWIQVGLRPRGRRVHGSRASLDRVVVRPGQWTPRGKAVGIIGDTGFSRGRISTSSCGATAGRGSATRASTAAYAKPEPTARCGAGRVPARIGRCSSIEHDHDPRGRRRRRRSDVRREAHVPRGGPDGGDGAGGSGYLVVDPGETMLIDYRSATTFKRHPEDRARARGVTGRPAATSSERCPQGRASSTTDNRRPDRRSRRARAARDGCARRPRRAGQHHFATSTHQTPKHATEGRAGEERRVRLELVDRRHRARRLRMPASPRCSRRSHTRDAQRSPTTRVTTLEPNLGVLELARDRPRDPRRPTIADVPGLIEVPARVRASDTRSCATSSGRGYCSTSSTSRAAIPRRTTR
jgi:hypothetical protein